MNRPLFQSIVASALSLSALATSAHAEWKVAPYEAVYEVSEGSKVIGRATVRLEKTASGFRYSNHLKGTAGMAKMLGADIQENTEFVVKQDHVQPVRYRYQQDVAFSQRVQTGELNWADMRATGTYKKDNWQAALKPNTLNRHVVDLQLAQALAGGAREFSAVVLDRGDFRDWRFVSEGEQDVKTPAGNFRALKVSRVRATDDNKQTLSYFAPSLGYLPVRIEQLESDGRRVVMNLLTKPKTL
jgi:hypothetical protein